MRVGAVAPEQQRERGRRKNRSGGGAAACGERKQPHAITRTAARSSRVAEGRERALRCYEGCESVFCSMCLQSFICWLRHNAPSSFRRRATAAMSCRGATQQEHNKNQQSKSGAAVWRV